MASTDRDAERQAVSAAIARGELTQIARFSDEIKYIADELEIVKAKTGGSAFGSAVNDVEVIEDNAKTADIRDGLQSLQERFNELLASLRAAHTIGE